MLYIRGIFLPVCRRSTVPFFEKNGAKGQAEGEAEAYPDPDPGHAVQHIYKNDAPKDRHDDPDHDPQDRTSVFHELYPPNPDLAPVYHSSARGARGDETDGMGGGFALFTKGKRYGIIKCQNAGKAAN